MSFIIQDKSLVDLLLKYGQAAQGPSTQEKSQLLAWLNILGNKISSNGPIEGPEITTGSGQKAELTSMSMKNFSDFIQWLGLNGIKVDGKNVVVGQNEAADDPSYLPYEVVDTSMRPSRVAATMKVNRDLLVQFLNSLRSQLVKNPNPVMKAQVDGMIRDARERLGANVGKYQAPEATLQDNYPLDKVPNDFKSDNPYADGPIVLTYGDIKSPTNFNNWIQTNNIGVNGRAYRHPQYDKCGLINALGLRAKKYVGDATSDKAKTAFDIYASEVSKLQKIFDCSSNDQKEQGQGSDQGAGAAAQAATMQQIVESLPLQNNDLDFGRIRNFINQYKGLITAAVGKADQPRSAAATAAMAQAEQFMQQATTNTLASQTNFKMDGMNAQDLISWSSPPQGGQPVRARGSARALADYLEYVVRAVVTMISDFYNTHAQELNEKPEWRQLVEQQVGGSHIPSGSSIAADNIRNITNARSYLAAPGSP